MGREKFLEPAQIGSGIVLGFLLSYTMMLLSMAPKQLPTQAQFMGNEAAFETSATCMLPESGTGEDPWYSMKQVVRPSRCRVKGFVIEELDIEYNFRRKYTLGFTDNVEDKDLVLPYMLAVQDSSLQDRKRRVLLDLGGQSFTSSTSWFLRNYPLDFTEVHAFERRANFFVIPDHHPNDKDHLSAITNQSRAVPSGRPLPIPNWALDRIHLHQVYVGIEDVARGDGTWEMINITRFMKEELKLTPEDAVIVKMDIEAWEWKILPAWMADPEMPKIVDELFVEIHYTHPSMYAFGWDHLKQPNGALVPSREEAAKLFLDLRNHGLFVHPWP